MIDRIASIPSRCVPEDAAKHFIYHVLLAIEYAHSRGIVHRDLKAEHVMFETRDLLGKPILIDWGDAMRLDDDDDITIEDFGLCPSIQPGSIQKPSGPRS